ncbi:hypothetical protein [Microcystis aeruginosa]|uniref:hypothetical protein n=1 Tax=Microcystis aeruginosa TaxID=1126 RepID=UPI000261BFE9|nr:hypothetical protein [Microcystis aeruginosa]CCI09267.1 conserved hypothetical protein [Microcystis aeruginosa PCC 7941]
MYATIEKVDIMSYASGEWTAFSFSITESAKNVFDAALKGFVGVGYTPLAFATQVVAGMNYCFLCKGKVVYPNAPDLVVLVYIYKPPQGAPHITKISQINP